MSDRPTTDPQDLVSEARNRAGILRVVSGGRDDNARLIDQLAGEIERIRNAIRKHRDQRGDSRCWLDDEDLYDSLSHLDQRQPYSTALPPKCEFLKSCERFWEQRQHPDDSPDSGMTIAQLESEIERLQADLRDARVEISQLKAEIRAERESWDRLLKVNTDLKADLTRCQLALAESESKGATS